MMEMAGAKKTHRSGGDPQGAGVMSDDFSENISAEGRKLQDDLFTLAHKLEAWNQAPFDGVLGQLPKWIPKNFHRDFRKIRGVLLHAYSHDDLLGFIAETVECFYNDNDGKAPPLTPDGIALKILALAKFQKAVQLGEEAGLALLTDSEHAGQVIQGKKFLDGRKPGAIGPVRKFVRAALKKPPRLTNDELWAAIKKRPPKGWTPIESPRLGRYIEGPKPTDSVNFATFRNCAAKERRRLKFTD